MSFLHFVRRTHLYLGMALMPWFLMYGVSSLPFAHRAWFERPGQTGPEWMLRSEQPYAAEIPAQGDLRPIADQILRGLDLSGAFYASRDRDGSFRIHRFDFRKTVRVTYLPAQKLLRIEDQPFRWPRFLSGLHARGGFEQPIFLHWVWAVLVDLVCLGIVLWIASGIYMWWYVAGHRRWGWLAIGAGVLSFTAFLLIL